MTTALILTAFAVLILILFSGFFSGSETALTASSRARMHHLENAGNPRAKIVNRLMETRERLIGAILLGNNLVNILASALATSLFISLFGEAGVIYATLVMTALVVIFAEVLPKTYAILHADRVSLLVAPLVRLAVVAFAPVSVAIEAIVKWILKLLRADRPDDEELLTAHEELRGAIDLHHREGGVVKNDRDMLGGILDLKELDLSDIMVHRTKMATINIGEPADEIVKKAISSPYTRIPLWKDEPENIVGILHAKDLVRAIQKAQGKADGIDIAAIARKPWFVPDTTLVDDQLRAFLKKRAHFALVVDEYGEVQGLVTLEDILEEIVGDISDEHDIAVSGVRPQPDGSVIADGTVPVRDLNRCMDWELPDEEANTIAGLVIHEAQQIPEKSQTFTFYGFRFSIAGRQRNRLTSIRITPLRVRHGQRTGTRQAAE